MRKWPPRPADLFHLTKELVDIVKNLVETPEAVAGKFDDKFLEVPKEVLITAMRLHQKYFAVADSKDPCHFMYGA